MIDGETILALARSSATRAARRMSYPYPTREDREDAEQTAALAIVAAPTGRSNGYYVVAGANAIITYLTRTYRQPPTRRLLATDVQLAQMEEPPDRPIAIERGRRHGGWRAVQAIERDTQIVALRRRNYTEREIANELGLTKTNVHTALRRLAARQQEAA